MNDKLKTFINQNLDLIQENTRESWEEIYNRLSRSSLLKGEFTKTILDAGINDPAAIIGYIPKNYLLGSDIQEYVIPSNVMSIISEAFSGCSRLTSIEIPDSVTYIGYEAFWGCSGLTEIVIPDSVKTIEGRAFAWCESLTSIVIPNNVINIGESVFAFCNSLKEIHYKGTKKNALTKLKVRNKRWREQSAIEKITCIDGIIEL